MAQNKGLTVFFTCLHVSEASPCPLMRLDPVADGSLAVGLSITAASAVEELWRRNRGKGSALGLVAEPLFPTVSTTACGPASSPLAALPRKSRHATWSLLWLGGCHVQKQDRSPTFFFY